MTETSPHDNRGDKMLHCPWKFPRNFEQWTAGDKLHITAAVLARCDDPHPGGYEAVSAELFRVGQILVLRELLEAAEQQVVTEARNVGHSWAEIGKQLGVTKQAALQRYGHRQ